jgi:hypothetical protein
MIGACERPCAQSKANPRHCMATAPLPGNVDTADVPYWARRVLDE